MSIDKTIKQGEELLDTMSFSDLTNKVNDSFNALLMLTELYKTGNPDLIDILNTVENGR
jgi:hypothetical protein